MQQRCLLELEFLDHRVYANLEQAEVPVVKGDGIEVELARSRTIPELKFTRRHHLERLRLLHVHLLPQLIWVLYLICRRLLKQHLNLKVKLLRPKDVVLALFDAIAVSDSR